MNTREALHEIASLLRFFGAVRVELSTLFLDGRHGRMRLCDVPDRCTYAQDECSEGCGAEAVGADDKGNAWCEEHRQGER